MDKIWAFQWTGIGDEWAPYMQLYSDKLLRVSGTELSRQKTNCSLIWSLYLESSASHGSDSSQREKSFSSLKNTCFTGPQNPRPGCKINADSEVHFTVNKWIPNFENSERCLSSASLTESQLSGRTWIFAPCVVSVISDAFFARNFQQVRRRKRLGNSESVKCRTCMLNLKEILHLSEGLISFWRFSR